MGLKVLIVLGVVVSCGFGVESNKCAKETKNAIFLSCTSVNSCIVTCKDGFVFHDGTTTNEIECVYNSWFIKHDEKRIKSFTDCKPVKGGSDKHGSDGSEETEHKGRKPESHSGSDSDDSSDSGDSGESFELGDTGRKHGGHSGSDSGDSSDSKHGSFGSDSHYDDYLDLVGSVSTESGHKSHKHGSHSGSDSGDSGDSGSKESGHRSHKDGSPSGSDSSDSDDSGSKSSKESSEKNSSEDYDSKSDEDDDIIGTNIRRTNPKKPKTAICTTWNGNRIKTFDGIIYEASLQCAQTLVQDAIDGSFEIILKSCPISSGQPCPHTLIIMEGKQMYFLTKIDNVIQLYTRDQHYPLPVQIDGIDARKIGSNVKITLEFLNLEIMWDKQKLVTIKITESLWNRVRGLCGTFDVNTRNEFTTRENEVMTAGPRFEASWRIKELDNAGSKCDIYSDTDECQEHVRKSGRDVCQQLLDQPKFAECVGEFSREELLKACIGDYCSCKDKHNREKCACDGITVAAKECILRGVILENGWTNLHICPVKCPTGQVYKECGPALKPTCSSRADIHDTDDESLDECHEDCFCPENTVYHNRKCISQESCPCEISGRLFNNGAQIPKECNKCTCTEGHWQCTDKVCGARCEVIGHNHHITFDRQYYDFSGSCSYSLLSSGNLTIAQTNVNKMKIVTIKLVVGSRNLAIKLQTGNTVLIDGTEVTKLPRAILDGIVTIRRPSSYMIAVEFEDGVRVLFDGVSRLLIDVPPTYLRQTSGLCGTFTNNWQDDFLTPEGDVESTVLQFANKWRAPELCELAHTVQEACKMRPENIDKAVRICNQLYLDSPLVDGNYLVSPDEFNENCMTDVCACEDSVLEKCACPVFAAYAAEVARQGHNIVNWRSKISSCSIKCDPGQFYEQCGNSCLRTCSDLQTNAECKFDCIEGCRCPHGQLLNDDNECIRASACPCSYKGLFYNSGHKELRPGSSHLELCTCVSAKWSCTRATETDIINYPVAENNTAKCKESDHEIFTTCEPSDVKTCSNMHLPVAGTSPAECRPGCVCMDGYVFDVSRRKCVLPQDCSCHHAGRSYDNFGTIEEDCNTCTCRSGKWECTKRICGTTCSAWGDSHFDTFDGKSFGFQGVCRYVLAKGRHLNGDGFLVTIQNTLCGSGNVTCSKSVKISLTGSHTESLLLDTELPTPERKTLNDRLTIYRAGVFIVVEAVDLGLQLKWDRGTRIYVKLARKWHGLTDGLCGNNNQNANDDYGMYETNLIKFAHSWRDENYCSVPTELNRSPCDMNPMRKVWAERKCETLKSDVFKKCHAEVPVETYLKRCLFDTCACDLGGDCECLCTALAAYAHACTMKGIPIKWRTPDLCPMQCDPHCSNYSPCISPCPVETCENALEQGKDQRMCRTESCVEGCQLKPCERGFIYKNATSAECVPESECKPVCMKIGTKIYYEGDVLEQDKCHTCHCSRGKSKCTGYPCPTPSRDKSTTTMATTTVQCNSDSPLQEVATSCNKYDICVDGTYARKKCPFNKMFNPITKSCSHQSIVIDIREECYLRPRPHGKSNTTCLPGYEYNDCKTPCEKSCNYAASLMKEECTLTGCFPGCHLSDEKFSCEKGRLYNEEGECVPIASCTCVSNDGKIIKPGGKFEKNECTLCQCLENRLVCSSTCTTPTVPPTTSTEPTRIIPPYTTIATVSPPPACPSSNLRYIISGKAPLDDSIFSASSSLNTKSRPQNARYHEVQHNVWRPNVYDAEPYLQITLPKLTPIYGIIIQGSLIDDAYVTSYEVRYSLNNITFQGLPHKLSGPTDSGHTKIEYFGTPIEAKILQIYPKTHYKSIAMAVELIGCSEEESTLMPTVLPTIILPICKDPMGGLLRPGQIEVKSTDSSKNPMGLLDLMSPTGWTPAVSAPNQFAIFNFLKPQILTGIITKGGPKGWVKSFNIEYALPGENWNSINDDEGEPKIFDGNYDSDTPKETLFKLPIRSQFIKITPKTWHMEIVLRCEILGCFDDTEITTIEPVDTTTPVFTINCPTCPGVLNSPLIIDEEKCRCAEPRKWNGHECVRATECSCIVGTIPYKVGTTFENDDCSSCICMIGGVADCKPKKCPVCSAGTRRLDSIGCSCHCEPCPPDSRLCPSSGACVDATLWCDGVMDCDDDETGCESVPEITTMQVPFVDTTTAPTRPMIPSTTPPTKKPPTCREPICPPGYVVSFTKVPTQRLPSPLLSSTIRTKLKSNYGKTKARNEWAEWIDPRFGYDKKTTKTVVPECASYSCVKIVNTVPCDDIECPEGHEISLLPYVPHQCLGFSCFLPPEKDAVCNITATTFNTFDGTEYKYDICSHVLARNFVSQSWFIAERKDCSTGKCKIEIEINDLTHNMSITIRENLDVTVNNYHYRVDSLAKSDDFKSIYTISKTGEILTFASTYHGFWLMMDKSMDLKIGVSPTNINQIDGLCGYYNGEMTDDKRLRNRQPARSTVEFGDDWYDGKMNLELCTPLTCSVEMRQKAVEMCNAVHTDVFAPCTSIMDLHIFNAQCIDSACECMSRHSVHPSSADVTECKCSILQKYVSDCLSVKSTVNLDGWHNAVGCDTTCTSPMVYKDCYNRQCEPTIDTTSSEDCPVMEGFCFPGCYCPEGTFRDGDKCTPDTKRLDCKCSGYDQSNYKTYDKRDFQFKSNCTYLLSRDVSASSTHEFQVYVTLGECASASDLVENTGSCTRAFHVITDKHVVRIQRNVDQTKLEVLINEILTPLPIKQDWINVLSSSDSQITIDLAVQRVELTLSIESFEFFLSVPSYKYSSVLEGLCGDCDRDPTNDFDQNPRQMSKPVVGEDPIKSFTLSWLADEPRLGPKDMYCDTDKHEHDCDPPIDDPCTDLLTETDIFGKCHLIVNPEKYIRTCQTDMCDAGSEDDHIKCSHFSAYAKACLVAGVCLNWRSASLCNLECLPGLTYSPCDCPKTCESLIDHRMDSSALYCGGPLTEGCFCAPGQVLQNHTCIDKRKCDPCHDGGDILYYPGDKWTKGACTKCQCLFGGKTDCTTIECSPLNCEIGFEAKVIVDNGKCCEQTCVPIPCEKTTAPTCGEFQELKQTPDINGCPKYVCECIPDCPPVPMLTDPHEMGMVLKETKGCCPTVNYVCDDSLCPEVCFQEFYKLEKVEGKCCKECLPPKDMCIVKNSIIGETKILKAIGEVWPTSDPCIKHKCIRDIIPIEVTVVENCHNKTCKPGYEYQNVKGQCCGNCVQTSCFHDGKIYKLNDSWHINGNMCEEFTCLLQDKTPSIASEKTKCPDLHCPEVDQVDDGCCKKCLLTPEASVLCHLEPIHPADTVGLITQFKVGHGNCSNRFEIANLQICKGTCNSYQQFNMITNNLEMPCTCCLSLRSNVKVVELVCDDGHAFNERVNVPESCNCNMCGNTVPNNPVTRRIKPGHHLGSVPIN